MIQEVVSLLVLILWQVGSFKHMFGVLYNTGLTNHPKQMLMPQHHTIRVRKFNGLMVNETQNDVLRSVQQLIPPPINQDDVTEIGQLLGNIASSLKDNPGQALSLASQNLEWLLSRNIPKLTEQYRLQNTRSDDLDKVITRSYEFLMDFLESVAYEASELVNRNQRLTKSLFETLKKSEQELDQFIIDNMSKLTSPEFLIFLKTEISNQPPQSEMYNILITVQLRLLDELGKSWGVDVRALPRLAAEQDFIMRKKKVLEHIEKYDTEGKLLFVQTLRIMMSEISRRYKEADPGLLVSLKHIEKVILDILPSPI